MDRFKLGKKWFWIGVVISLVYPLAGLIYAIALVCEKNYQKEGWILIVISLILGVIGVLLSNYFVNKGWLSLPTWHIIHSPKEGDILPLINQ